MGYYVKILRSTYRIHASHITDAYAAMCELNKLPASEKRGQRSGGGLDPKDPRNHWFSWMEWNYPETCTDAAAIFSALGFTHEVDAETGDLLITGYDDKTGQEELFLTACEPYAEGIIEWKGEEGEIWVYEVPKRARAEMSGQETSTAGDGPEIAKEGGSTDIF